MYKSNIIPVGNIYYMVLYAWDRVKDISNIANKDLEEIKDINHVLIDLFLNDVQELLRSGIYKDYTNVTEESKFIKGKIQIKETIKIIQPKIVCSFDEYSEDILHNRIIKSILLRISRFAMIKKEDKKRTRNLLSYFSNVSNMELGSLDISPLAYNRFNKDYEKIIDLGVFIYKNSIPTESKGQYKFIDIMEDEEEMSLIFEEFLRNFYKIHSSYKVDRRYYYFDWEAVDSSDIGLLPRMETDIELTDSKHKIIIDAKYYKSAFSSRYEARKLIGDNIYQMKTYLIQNLKESEKLRGILLYPSNGYSIDERFSSGLGFTMEFRTIDLSMKWEDIKSKLLNIV